MENIYFIEMTDTYGGEANYSWVNRYKVKANTIRGAIVKISKELGLQGQLKKIYDCGDTIRHDVKGCAICLFSKPFDEYDNQYSRIIEL